jgi:soluble lytic murein transglycosylase-like protein
VSKVKNKKNFALSVIVVALSSTAIAVAAEPSPVPADASNAQPKLLQSKGLSHGPIGTRPSTPAALQAKAKHLEHLKREKAKAAAVPSGPVAGVSQATLDAIAACESGGDPTAVNAGGYYGKYQFDTGTWASVGGTGNPADASEGEQDYRASLLYEQAGASPWPVCGQ